MVEICADSVGPAPASVSACPPTDAGANLRVSVGDALSQKLATTARTCIETAVQLRSGPDDIVSMCALDHSDRFIHYA